MRIDVQHYKTMNPQKSSLKPITAINPPLTFSWGDMVLAYDVTKKKKTEIYGDVPLSSIII